MYNSANRAKMHDEFTLSMKREKFFYLLRLTGGWLLVVLGVIITPLPLPVGLIMVASGLALLAHDSIWIQRKIRALRARFPGFSAKLKSVEPHLGGMFSQLLRRTDPDA